jgi:hypothetical protein
VRPTYPEGAEQTFDSPGGNVRVHYVTSGGDAVLAGDSDGDGVPDFVAEVGDRAEESLAAFAGLGFQAPLPDGAITDNGGDGRIDIYLRDLTAADGEFSVEGCSGEPPRCTGYLVVENDFAGFSYPTTSLGIQVLTSHELFHAVQASYDADEPTSWREGSAVWAEEVVFPEQSDFEGLVAAFLARPFRPFDREGGGFGDLYPYGTALWSYYLAERHEPELIVRIWAGNPPSGSSDVLDRTDQALAGFGSSLEQAWIEFTRWNAETGAAANPGWYPGAARLALAAREPALAIPGEGSLSIEGMSARYLPLTVGDAAAAPDGFRIVIDAERPVAVALRATTGEISRSDGAADDALATSHAIDVRPVDGELAGLELIVTGATRGALPADVAVSVGLAPPAADDGGCGCAAGGSAGPDAGALLLALGVATLLAGRRP